MEQYFAKSLEILMSQINSKAKISPEAVVLIKKLVENVGKKIIGNVKKSAEVINFEPLEKVIKETFPQEIGKTAVANGRSAIQKYLSRPNILKNENLSFVSGLYLNTQILVHFLNSQELIQYSDLFLIYFTAVWEYLLMELLGLSDCLNGIEIRRIRVEDVRCRISQNSEFTLLFA